MIGIGSDHGGFKLKQEIVNYLKEERITFIDYGTINKESTDYPKYAFKVGEAIRSNKIKYGILICKTGIGMSIACNKVKGVRCAKVNSEEEAYFTRLHNDSNVLALSSNLSIEQARNIVIKFLQTDFSNEERHINRVNMIKNYEETNEY